jgi:hypothetical protein
MSERIPEGMSGDSPPDRGDFDSGQVHAHSPSATGAMSGSKTGVEESTSDVTRQAKDKTQEVARQAQEKADQGINQAAGGLETAAEKLREKTPSSRPRAICATVTASRLLKTSRTTRASIRRRR